MESSQPQLLPEQLPPPTPRRQPPTEAPLLNACLLALAIIWVFLGVAGGAVVLAEDIVARDFHIATIVWMLIMLAAGCSAALVTWAVALMLRQHNQRVLLEQRLGLTLDQLANMTAGWTVAQHMTSTARNDSGAAAAKANQALLEELRDLNVNLLLSDQQRTAKRHHLLDRRTQQLRQELHNACARADIKAAQDAFDHLLKVAPDLEDLAALQERLNVAAHEAQLRGTQEATRWAQDFMAAGDFSAAEAAARQLLTDFPHLAEGQELLARVQREREVFHRERRTQMYQRVQAEAASRHWRSALEAAQALLDAYGDSPEGDAVATQMPTLRDNARIEEARQMRDRITDLISRKRFTEALELARQAVERFPQTAVAEELRQQMARLEELASTTPSGQDAQI